MKRAGKVQLVLLALIVSTLILIVSYPYSLALAFVAIILFFASMGKAMIVIGTVVSGMIVLTSMVVEYAVVHIPWEGFMRSREWMVEDMKLVEKVPRGFKRLKEDTYFSEIRDLRLLGNGIRVLLSRKAKMMHLEKGLYYKSDSEKLGVFSKDGGKIIGPPVDSIEIDGMNIDVKGFGDSMKMQLDGMGNTVELETEKKLDVRVAGMDNSLDFKSSIPGQVKISGLGNRIEVDLAEASFGAMWLEVNGVDNHVEIYIPENGNVKIEKNVNPAFMNEVKVIRR